jgi:hypothetical protein
MAAFASLSRAGTLTYPTKSTPKSPFTPLLPGLRPCDGDYVFMCLAPSFLRFRSGAVTRIRKLKMPPVVKKVSSVDIVSQHHACNNVNEAYPVSGVTCMRLRADDQVNWCSVYHTVRNIQTQSTPPASTPTRLLLLGHPVSTRAPAPPDIPPAARGHADRTH